MRSEDSEQRSARIAMINMLCDRTFLTLLLSTILVACMGALRPDKTRVGMYPKEYWAKKIGWKHCANVILTGDSRTLMALSPTKIKKILNYDKIYNYGFGGNWYSVEYLQAVEDLLRPKEVNKVIIMGISPHSLTQGNAERGNFSELSKLSKQEAYLDIHFAPLVNFFEPMSFRDALEGLFPSIASSHTEQIYMPDGFVAVHKTPSNRRNEVKRYRKIYEKSQVSDQTIDNVTRFIKKWTKENIKVYGFLLPSCSEMYELERKVSGFNQKEFVKLFEASGGIWVEVNPVRYESFDGSHLQDHAAMEYSRDLAMAIREIEENTINDN